MLENSDNIKLIFMCCRQRSSKSSSVAAGEEDEGNPAHSPRRGEGSQPRRRPEPTTSVPSSESEFSLHYPHRRGGMASGGYIAIELADSYPERVAGLVLMGDKPAPDASAMAPGISRAPGTVITSTSCPAPSSAARAPAISWSLR